MSKFTALAAVAAITFGAAASATPVTMYANWTGTGTGTASATFTIDDAIFDAAINYSVYPAALIGLSGLTISINSGGSSFIYDATITSNWSYILGTNAAVDVTSNLLSQSDFIDFNFFGNSSAGEPYGTGPNYFNFVTTSENFTLTSLSTTALPAVPVPASLPLMAAGIGALAALRRRKKAA